MGMAFPDHPAGSTSPCPTGPTEAQSSAHARRAAALIRNGRGRANGSVGLVPVDILTVDLLREHQRGQDAERAAWGKASRY
jgi:hypothetical protein